MGLEYVFGRHHYEQPDHLHCVRFGPRLHDPGALSPVDAERA
nr:MAG TPA: hypothetical protein [Caudoviricetes sp.]